MQRRQDKAKEKSVLGTPVPDAKKEEVRRKRKTEEVRRKRKKEEVSAASPRNPNLNPNLTPKP